MLIKINMKNIIGILFAVIIFTSCGSGEAQTKTVLPKVQQGQQVATFAGGCFWGLQEGFSELKGVIKSTSGYSGGTKKDPTYEQVSSEVTGHAESVQIIYDPKVISYAQLLAAFFVMHDPSTLNRQGPDEGTSYRSIAFYRNADEKKQIETAIKKYNSSLMHLQPAVTEVKAFDVFYAAENYHQNYVKLNSNSAYVQNVCGPKIQKLRSAFPELLKNKMK